MAYKDSLFRSIFGNEKSVLRLYNALYGTSFAEQDTEVVLNTLAETLWTWRKNDLSFLINQSLVVVVEHQASINENMPYRLLQYICRLLENAIQDKKAVYRQAMVKHARPRFVVFYNGTASFPDRKTMRLSDSFRPVPGFDGVCLELEVEVYNINDGRNRDILDACLELKGYAYFVSHVRWHERELEGRQECGTSEEITLKAIKMAIQDCKQADLLAEFWESMSGEEMNMLYNEFSLDTALEVREEEGREKGRVEGRVEEREEWNRELLSLVDKGYTMEDIGRELVSRATGNAPLH